MKGYRIYLIGIVTILYSCFSGRKVENYQEVRKSENNDVGYYKDFTEATKNALIFGNYKNAINLYAQCIARYPEHAAPYYQISSIYLRTNKIDLAKKYGIKAEELDQSNIWYKLQIANIYQYENNYDSAAYMYEEIIKLDKNPEYFYNLAILYGHLGRNQDALKILNSFEGDLVGSKELFVMKHNMFHSLMMYDSAVYQLEMLTKYFPEDVNSYGMLAEYLLEIGRNNYAKEVYKNIIDSDSTNGLVYLSYGDYFLKNNQVDSAFIYYRKALCCCDINDDSKYGVIVNFIKNKDFVSANNSRIEELIDVLLEKDSLDFRALTAYSDLFIVQKKYDKAKLYLERSLEVEKDNYLLWEQAILVDNYLGYDSDLIAKATECLSRFKDKPNIYLVKAYAERELKMEDSALIDLDCIVKLKPEKDLLIQTYNLYAEIYRIKEIYDSSDYYFEKILEIDPENLMIRNNYGYYLSVRGIQLDKAKKLSQLTIEKEPRNSTYLDTYGWILFKMGEYKQAKNYIEAAIRNGAYNNPEVLDHYGEIMLMLDNCKDAIEAWEKISEIDSTYLINKNLNELKENCK